MAKTKKAKGFKVKAIGKGYYGNKVREEGDIFFIKKAGDFSSRWMKDLTIDKNLKKLRKKFKAKLEAERKELMRKREAGEHIEDEEPKEEEESELDETPEAGEEAPEDEEPEEEEESEVDEEPEEGEEAPEDEEPEDVPAPSEEELVKAALEELDHSNDEHWNNKGLPHLVHLAKVLDNKAIKLTRKYLDEVAPELKRKDTV